MTHADAWAANCVDKAPRSLALIRIRAEEEHVPPSPSTTASAGPPATPGPAPAPARPGPSPSPARPGPAPAPPPELRIPGARCLVEPQDGASLWSGRAGAGRRHAAGTSRASQAPCLHLINDAFEVVLIFLRGSAYFSW